MPDAYLDQLRPEDRAKKYNFGSLDPLTPHTIVLTESGVIRGFATTVPAQDVYMPDYGELCALYVDPDHWGRGMGVALVSAAQSERSLKLRRKIVSDIKELFAEHVTVTHLPRRTRSVLLIDRSFMVSVVLCGIKSKYGTEIWNLVSNTAERDLITLVCTMKRSHDGVISYFLLPDMHPFRKLRFHDGRLSHAMRLQSLADFYKAARRLWAERSTKASVQRTSFP